MLLRHNNLNGSEEEVAKKRAGELSREVHSNSSFKSSIITLLILAIIFIAVFYGIAYFRTHWTLGVIISKEHKE